MKFSTTITLLSMTGELAVAMPTLSENIGRVLAVNRAQLPQQLNKILFAGETPLQTL